MNRSVWVLVLTASAASAQVPELRVDSLTVKNGRAELVVSLPSSLKPTAPVFVGWAFKKPRATEEWTDLPHVKVLPKDAARPVTLKAPLGPGFTHYTVVVWKEECDDSLCGPLVSIPTYSFGEDGYDGDGARWTPFVDVPVRIKVLDAGGGPEAVKAAIARVEAAFAGKQLAVKITDGGKAKAPRAKTEVMVRDAAHFNLGVDVQTSLKNTEPLKPWPESPDTIVIAIGK